MAFEYRNQTLCDECARRTELTLQLELWKNRARSVTPDGIKINTFETFADLIAYLWTMEDFDSEDYPREVDSDECFCGDCGSILMVAQRGSSA